MNLSELRREATALAIAESAIMKCCLALGDDTNRILALLDSKRRDIEDRIYLAEGRGITFAGKTSQP